MICEREHWHVWKWAEGQVYCDRARFEDGRDNPEPVDAEMSHIISNIEWTSVKHPVLKTLTQMIADAKNEIAEEVESSVLADLPRNPVGLSAWVNEPVRMPNLERNKLIKDLYGSVANYQRFTAVLHDLNRGRG